MSYRETSAGFLVWDSKFTELPEGSISCSGSFECVFPMGLQREGQAQSVSPLPPLGVCGSYSLVRGRTVLIQATMRTPRDQSRLLLFDAVVNISI